MTMKEELVCRQRKGVELNRGLIDDSSKDRLILDRCKMQKL